MSEFSKPVAVFARTRKIYPLSWPLILTSLGDKIIQRLIEDLRVDIAVLYRISDAVAMLDMVVLCVYLPPETG